jgi:hypothetical protein
VLWLGVGVYAYVNLFCLHSRSVRAFLHKLMLPLQECIALLKGLWKKAASSKREASALLVVPPVPTDSSNTRNWVSCSAVTACPYVLRNLH